jgi:Zn-dependent protease with chaperone function
MIYSGHHAGSHQAARDLKLLERLRKKAAQNPRAYRRRLAVLAVAGDIALTAIQVILPLAAIVLFGVLNALLLLGALPAIPVLFYWVGGAALIFLVWLARPIFRFDGRELTAQEAPDLHAAIIELRRTLQVAGRMSVFLDDSLNAGAAESRGLLGLFGTRFAITLGVPLLAALSRDQVLAVIAHELGHFSRRHGRLGHWLYRVRVSWIHYAQQMSASDYPLNRAAAWYSAHFVPFFSIRCFVHSRQCEYEADADAALAVGSERVAEALTRIAVIARLWNDFFPRQVVRWQIAAPQPPADYYERFAAAARTWSLSEQQPQLAEALRVPAGWIDTHPSLAERLASLGQKAALVTVAENAGAALLGERWSSILEEFSARWLREARPDWIIEHLRFKHITGALLDANEETVSGWNDDKRLAHANVLRRLDPAAGLAELRSLYSRKPAHAHVRLAYGAALLDKNDQSGVEVLENLAKESSTVQSSMLRVSSCGHLLAYFARNGDSEQTERWSKLLGRAADRQAEAISAFFAEADGGHASVTTLPADATTVLAEAINLDPCVTHGFLLEAGVQKTAKGGAAARIRALVLLLDPTNLGRSGQYDTDVAARYRRALAAVIAPDDIPAVRTYFTTEAVPGIYQPSSKYALGMEAHPESLRAG